MKKKFTRIIAGFLLASMIAGSLPTGTVSATEADMDEMQNAGQNLEETVGNILQNGENTGNVTEGTAVSDSGQTDQEQSVAAEQQPGEESSGTTDSLEIDKENEKIETGGIDFAYIESPYLETPGTQRIVFSFNQPITGTEEITLTVSDEAGNTEEWALSKQEENLYLFEKQYTGDAYTGTYRALSLNLYGEEEKTIILEEAGVNAEFGVNEEYEGIEELQPVDGTPEDVQASQVDASVVTIDENGMTEAQDSIANALNAVSIQMAATNGISTLNAASGASARTASSGNIVVALDPGHDANDAGAQANGLKEEVLTLKIAQYCKEELEQYSGVSVYMTRTTAACPYNCTSAGSCIEQRVQAAAAAGAQIYVSLHLNAAVAASANGAEVIIPNTSWRPGLAAEGEELAEAIMDELTALGLTWRRIYAQNTTVGETYEDGSISDYFSVQIYCKENNIPGIIVEHAFLTNTSDVNNFLKTEAGLKKLGVADATGIAKYLGLSKGYWDTDNAGNTYYYEGGQKVYGGKKIGNAWYYFDLTTGAMYHDQWREKQGEWYYYDSDGIMLANKGSKIDDYWYYFTSTGAMLQSGWRNKDGEWFYYDAEGHMISNQEIKIDVYWYYFTSTGAMLQSSWRQQEGNWYYYDAEGHKAVDKGLKIDVYWYYFTSDGTMLQSGWREKNGEKYYYDAEGHMAANKGVKIDGYWYYFTESGAMLQSGWREKNGSKYYYDAEGHMAANKGVKIDGYWYYFTESGAMLQSGWREKNGSKYYYDAEGHMAANKGVKIDGYWYYFTESGAMLQSGWREKNGEKYYYDAEGHMAANKGVKIDGYWYYFTESGAMLQSGWRDKNGENYYYDADGHMIADWVITIDGVTYYFDSSGVACDNLAEAKYETAGESSLTVQDLINYYENNSSIEFPGEALGKGGVSTLKEFCQIYYEECEAEGIKVEVAFAQAMLETGFLKYGGAVKIEQFNFAGLGAVGGDASGASFEDVRTGIRAHIQHLKCYANSEPLNNQCVDPRWGDWLRGKAPYVSWLSIPHNPNGTGWATDEDYGVKLMYGIGKILNG